jgi:hypothetical protein
MEKCRGDKAKKPCTMSRKDIERQTIKPRKNKQGSLKDKGHLSDSPRPHLEIKRPIK